MSEARYVLYVPVWASGVRRHQPTIRISQSQLYHIAVQHTGMRSESPRVLANIESTSTLSIALSFVGVLPPPSTGTILRWLCRPVQPTYTDLVVGFSFFFAPAGGLGVYWSSTTTS